MGEWFHCLLDDVRIYNCVLTVQEATHVYNTFTFVCDGARVKKTEGGETVLYVNQYYEKNPMTGVETSYYYHGGKLVALRKETALEYGNRSLLRFPTEPPGRDGGQHGRCWSGEIPADVSPL